MQQATTGRVDVLIVRLAEAVAMTQCPQEWPTLKPMVENFAQKFAPKPPKGRKRRAES